jgi:hypothetical protein
MRRDYSANPWECDECERLWLEYASAIIAHLELKEQNDGASIPQVRAARLAREKAESAFRSHRETHDRPRGSAVASGTP